MSRGKNDGKPPAEKRRRMDTAIGEEGIDEMWEEYSQADYDYMDTIASQIITQPPGLPQSTATLADPILPPHTDTQALPHTDTHSLSHKDTLPIEAQFVAPLLPTASFQRSRSSTSSQNGPASDTSSSSSSSLYPKSFGSNRSTMSLTSLSSLPSSSTSSGRSDIQGLKAEIENLRTALKSSKDKEYGKEGEIKMLRESLNKAKEERIESIRNVHTQKNEKEQSLKFENEKLNTQLQFKEREYQQLQDKYRKIEQRAYHVQIQPGTSPVVGSIATAGSPGGPSLVKKAKVVSSQVSPLAKSTFPTPRTFLGSETEEPSSGVISTFKDAETMTAISEAPCPGRRRGALKLDVKHSQGQLTGPQLVSKLIQSDRGFTQQTDSESIVALLQTQSTTLDLHSFMFERNKTTHLLSPVRSRRLSDVKASLQHAEKAEPGRIVPHELYILAMHGLYDLLGHNTDVSADTTNILTSELNTNILFRELGTNTSSKEPSTNTLSKELNSNTSSKELNSNTSSREFNTNTSSKEPSTNTSSKELNSNTSSREFNTNTSSKEPSTNTSSKEPSTNTSSTELITNTSSKEVSGSVLILPLLNCYMSRYLDLLNNSTTDNFLTSPSSSTCSLRTCSLESPSSLESLSNSLAQLLIGGQHYANSLENYCQASLTTLCKLVCYCSEVREVLLSQTKGLHRSSPVKNKKTEDKDQGVSMETDQSSLSSGESSFSCGSHISMEQMKEINILHKVLKLANPGQSQETCNPDIVEEALSVFYSLACLSPATQYDSLKPVITQGVIGNCLDCEDFPSIILAALKLLCYLCQSQDIISSLCTSSDNCPLLAMYLLGTKSFERIDSKMKNAIYKQVIQCICNIVSSRSRGLGIVLDTSCTCSVEIVRSVIMMLCSVLDQYHVDNCKDHLSLLRQGLMLLHHMSQYDSHFTEKHQDVQHCYVHLVCSLTILLKNNTKLYDHECILSALVDLWDFPQDDFELHQDSEEDCIETDTTCS